MEPVSKALIGGSSHNGISVDASAVTDNSGACTLTNVTCWPNSNPSSIFGLSRMGKLIEPSPTLELKSEKSGDS